MVVAALYLAAFLLARRRPRMTVIIGVVLAANALLLASACRSAGSCSSTSWPARTFGPASAVFYDTLLTYLERGWKVLLWLGLILVVAGWFTGSNAAGTAARTTVSGGLQSIGARRPARRTGRRRRPLGRRQRPLASGGHRPARCRRPALGQRPLGLPAALVAGARGRTPGRRRGPDRRPRTPPRAARLRAASRPSPTVRATGTQKRWAMAQGLDPSRPSEVRADDSRA